MMSSKNDNWSQKGHFHLRLISISDWYSVTNNLPLSLIQIAVNGKTLDLKTFYYCLNIFLLIILKTGNNKTLKTTYFEPQKDAGALRAGEGGQWDPDENQPQERVWTKYYDDP